MTIGSIKSKFLGHVFNSIGWRTDRKIIVFESDDWGMIRMASKQAYNYFLQKGLPVDKCLYNSNDTLESNDDLESLFEVLSCVKDKNGNYPVLTANNIVANPDFEKIKQNDFQEYYFEPFTETLKRYPNHDRVLDLYKEGINDKLFRPQFHGREHVNVANWMLALRQNEDSTRMAFEKNMFSIHHKNPGATARGEFLDAFGGDENRESVAYQNIISEGCDLFEKIHGYRATSFIAPCYSWSEEINIQLKKSGLLYLQGGRVQKTPIGNKKGFSKKYHYIGQRNKFGQTYLVRNASFEVAENPDKDWVGSCLKEVSSAFSYRKPAIISTHRVNFMGGLNSNNRSNTLTLFKRLLLELKRKWPEIEFMSSDQLGQLISNHN